MITASTSSRSPSLNRLLSGTALGALLTGVLVAAPRVARAQETPPAPTSSVGTGFAPVAAPGGGFAPVAAPGGGFGGTGQWVFTMETADSGGGFFFVHASGGNGSINLNPGVDYFIASNFSVGGSVSFFHDSSGGGSTSIGVGARAGYDLNITEHVGVWPTVRLFASHLDANHMGNSTSSLGIFAPFLYHLTPHFFLGAGPDFNLGLSGGSSKEYGIDFVIGGWI